MDRKIRTDFRSVFKGEGRENLNIDWLKILSRIPDIGGVFWELGHLDFSNMDLILSSMVETISIAVLSLLYSLLLGIFFGMLAARNIFRIPVLSVITQSFFTFLRAVPTPVWVLLMMVCLGMGPEAGVAILLVFLAAYCIERLFVCTIDFQFFMAFMNRFVCLNRFQEAISIDGLSRVISGGDRGKFPVLQ